MTMRITMTITTVMRRVPAAVLAAVPAAVLAAVLAYTLALGAQAAEPPKPQAPAAKANQKPAPRPQFVYPSAERTVVELTVAERNYLLNEMRYYLDLMWMVNESLSRDDLRTVAIVSKRRAELSAASRLPPELEAKLPSVYRAAWRETNRVIDDIAIHAGTPDASTRTVLGRMASLLQRCNECHALYQFRGTP